MGRAQIDSWPVWVVGDDFTVRGGSADATIREKPLMAEQMAHDLKLPIVRIIRGLGRRRLGQDDRDDRPRQPAGAGRLEPALLLHHPANLGRVPVVALGLGSVAGLGAARMAASHYSVMTKETSALFVAGPPVVNALNKGPAANLDRFELGGWEIQTRCGAVDHAVDSEEEAFACTRRFLSYLPSSVFEVTAARAADRRSGAARGIPVRGDPARPLQGLQDAPDHRGGGGPRLVLRDGPNVRPADHHRLRARRWTAGRGDGQRPVLLRRRVDRGCLRQDHPLCRPRRDLPPADRLSVRLPPALYRVGGGEGGDDPQGGARDGGGQPIDRAVVHVSGAQRFGVAGAVNQPSGRFSIRYAWLSARWGSLPLEGGIEAAYRAEIDAAEDPAAKRAEIEARLEKLRSPFRTAETFWIEEIIDPRDTRKLLVEFAGHAEKLRQPGESKFYMRP